MHAYRSLLLVFGITQSLIAGDKEWKPAGSIDGFSTQIYSLAFGPDSILVFGDGNGVRVWNVAKRDEYPFYQRPIENASAITSVTYAPDDTWVSFRGLHEIHMAFGRYLKDGRPTDWGQGMSDRKNGILQPLAIASDGETYAMRSGRKIKNEVDVQVNEFVRRSGKPSRRIQAICKGHQAEAECAAFSPDGKFLATGSSDKTVRLWNPATGEEMAVLNGHNDTVSAIEFSPDGRILASACKDATLRLWNVTDKNETASLQGKSAFRCIVFAKDGNSIASGDEEGNVQVWNVRDATLEATMSDQTGTVFAVAFSRDGKLLASGGQGKAIKFWSKPE